MPTWLVQGFVANAIWGIFAFIVGAAMTYLAKNYATWAGPLMYGFAAFVLVMILGLVLRMPGIVAAWRGPSVTPENIEQKIIEWSDEFGLAQQKASEDGFRFIRRSHLRAGGRLQYRSRKRT